MLNVELLEEYAYNVLKVALNNNDLRRFILGFPPYSIEIQDDSGNNSECIFAKMEAVYQYSKENPTAEIGEQLHELLKTLTVIVRSVDAFINVLRVVEYQIVAEQEKRAPFKMNYEELLENIKNNLAANKVIYTSEIYVQYNFMGTIQQHNEMLSRNYGYSIL